MSATQSFARSVKSVTPSEVSQVDFKIKANNVKNKLKGLLKSVDADKSGLVKWEVFFPMLDLHQVLLSDKSIAFLKKTFSKNNLIRYKEAVNALTIDLTAAAGTDEEATGAKMTWTVN